MFISEDVLENQECFSTVEDMASGGYRISSGLAADSGLFGTSSSSLFNAGDFEIVSTSAVGATFISPCCNRNLVLATT